MLNLLVHTLTTGPRRVKPWAQLSNQGLPNTTEDTKYRALTPGKPICPSSLSCNCVNSISDCQLTAAQYIMFGSCLILHISSAFERSPYLNPFTPPRSIRLGGGCIVTTSLLGSTYKSGGGGGGDVLPKIKQFNLKFKKLFVVE
jgi:hypothetical protein